MLGHEVAALVDGVKEVGSYSVTFDGGKLACGVYIMRVIIRLTLMQASWQAVFIFTEYL